MFDDEVERRKEHAPTGLPAVELGLSHESLEVRVIRQHFDGESGPFQIVAPVLEGVDDSEEFLIGRTIIQLGAAKLLGPESHRMVAAFLVGLGKDSSHAGVGCVGLQSDLASRVEMT